MRSQRISIALFTLLLVGVCWADESEVSVHDVFRQLESPDTFTPKVIDDSRNAACIVGASELPTDMTVPSQNSQRLVTITSDCVINSKTKQPETFYLDLNTASDGSIRGITFYGTNMKRYDATTKQTTPIYNFYNLAQVSDEVCLVQIVKLGITYNAACIETNYTKKYQAASGSTVEVDRKFNSNTGGFVKLDYLVNGKNINLNHVKGSRDDNELFITKENGKWVLKWLTYHPETNSFDYTEVNSLKLNGNGYGDDCVGTKSVTATKK